METKNKHHAILFKSYIETTFLNSKHKTQLSDTSVISVKTDNLLKAIGKLFFWDVFRPEQSGKNVSKNQFSMFVFNFRLYVPCTVMSILHLAVLPDWSFAS